MAEIGANIKVHRLAHIVQVIAHHVQVKFMHSVSFSVELATNGSGGELATADTQWGERSCSVSCSIRPL